jgi:cyclic pyranopterin phosphate synthase
LLPQKIDKLYEAGLRDISVGFYGLGADLDAYVQRRGHAEKFERGIAAVRERYGSNVSIQLNWLLRRDTCSVETLEAAFDFAKKYETLFQVDMIHYSLPYFTKGMDQELYFRPEDRPAIERVIDRLLRLKAEHPNMVHSPEPALRSISDWLLLGPEMKVPCTAGEIIWIGPDGSVQLCYVTFKLGNLQQKRLKDMLFSKDHADAARGAFKLDCPNCHCEAGDRVMRHAPSRRLYEIPIRVTDSR